MSIFTHHPFKALWVLFAVAINAVRLPLWIISYILPSGRPHPAWSLSQAIRVQIVKAFLYNAAKVEMKTPLSLLPKSEKQQWAVARPADQKYYTGIVKADPTITPGNCGGTWYPAKPSKTAKPDLVVLHYHGGAYVIGDGRTQDAGFAAKTLLANTKATHVFAPQYRLASNSNGRFPAALQDAITTYAYLVLQEGIPENKIVFSGDSAGANLALALTRYLTDNKASVPLANPLCTLLWSPWVSPNRSLTSEAFDASPNKTTDYIPAEFGAWGANTYLPSKKSGLTLDDPYISFKDHAFATSTPIYISGGECEVLFPDIIQLAEQFKAIPGNKVELQIEEHCVHDTILVGAIVGFEKEAQQGVRRAGKYIERILSGAKL